MSNYHEEQELLECALAAMSRKLHDNHGKRTWRRDGLGALMDRLAEETEEVREALDDAAMTSDPERWQRVIDECADVGNFAAMIIDQVHEHRKIPRPEPGRWADRVMLLHRRAQRASAILFGRPDPYPDGGS